MNQRLTEYNLNKDELEQLIDKYITTIVDSMSMEDFRQYVRNDMWDYLGNLSFSVYSVALWFIVLSSKV